MFPLPKGARPAGITAGPDGNLWVADSTGLVIRLTTAGAIKIYPLHQTSSALQSPLTIARGADGNLWLTVPTLCWDAGCNSSIARITPAGRIAEFPVKSALKH